MANLTIRMDATEKMRLSAWAASKGQNVTDYLKDLVAADMAAGSPEKRAEAWMTENQASITAEADAIERLGIPGANLAVFHPRFDDQV